MEQMFAKFYPEAEEKLRLGFGQALNVVSSHGFQCNHIH